MKNSINKLLKDSSTKKIILIGEMHGVVENVEFVKTLLSQLIEQHKYLDFIAVEYPLSDYDFFIDCIADDNYKKLATSRLGEILIDDGKLSQHHFDFLKELLNMNIKIFFFDSYSGEWDQRDEDMYKNLKPHIDSIKHKAIIVAGNIHTKLEAFNIVHNNTLKEYKPLGSYLEKKEVLLVNLQYDSGEFFNKKRQQFENKNSEDFKLVKNIDNSYDFHIPVAHPIK